MSAVMIRDEDLRDMVLTMWPGLATSITTIGNEEDYSAFYSYMKTEVVSFWRSQAQTAGAVDLCIITKVLKLLVVGYAESKAELATKLSNPEFPPMAQGTKDCLLELSARLWLTVKIGGGQNHGKTLGPSNWLEWECHQSLKDCVRSVRDSEAGSCNIVTDAAFTAATLTSMCGVHILWTSNLLDHLYFDRHSRVLHVYEHKLCIMNHLKHSEQDLKWIGDARLFSLLRETMDTLNLLFPFTDQETKAFLTRQGRPFYGLGLCGRKLQYSLSQYPHWHARLADLVELFNEPPQRWRQILMDRRDKVQWATFWIAALVLVLTIISIIFGVVSSVYAVKQYNLALAQACSGQDAQVQLPHFCA